MGLREMQTDHWRGQKNVNISAAYFNSPPGIQRSQWFVNQLQAYTFDSIFEVGCMSGRNIFHIQRSYPNVRVGGLDVNPRAIRYAREKLNLDKELMCMDLHDLPKIQEKFGIVFTSGVLIHVPLDDIANVLQKMLNMSNKYVMHIEQNGSGELVAGPKHLKPSYKVSDQLQWAPDLLGAYKDFGYTPKAIPLPKDCRTNGASELLIVEK